ncbi:MAG: DUF3822 family protein [Pedobacter sp.]|nr:MAG: DUF3822 family protein [Pedobacter sp.]
MSNNNSILLIDPNFEPANATNCSLLVKIGTDSFSYAIIDKERNKVIAVYDEQECDDVVKKLNEKLKTDNYLGLTYQEVKIAAQTANLLSIPDELFSEEVLEANTQYFADSHDGNVHVKVQQAYNFSSVFAFPKRMSDIFENFTDAKIFHESAGVLNLATNFNVATLLLDFSVGSFNALFVNDGKLIFQQSYEIEDADEFNYYLLLIKNQLKLEDTLDVKLMGIIHQDDAKHKVLKKYFSSLIMLISQGDLNTEVLEDMPAHYYTTLLALNECV